MQILAFTSFLIALFFARRSMLFCERLKALQERFAEQKRKLQEGEIALENLEKNLQNEREKAIELAAKISALQDLQNQWKESQKSLKDSFEALSSRALKNNNQSFLELAKESLQNIQKGAENHLDKKTTAINALFEPIKESLEKVERKMQDFDKSRQSGQSTLSEQIRQLLEAQSQLRGETANLVRALRVPHVRGRWGELQLQRVAEMAGMLQHCDFYQQESITAEDGRLRPDMLVRLPNKKQIVVDSKVPLYAYLEAMQANDDNKREELLMDHARQLGTHVKQLGQKAYWQQFKPSPEFVILFLPGEPFFSAALEKDPGLIEAGVEKNVLIATPTTLIALLRAVAYGWRQEDIAKNAEAMSALGRDLYDRIRVLSEHFLEMKKGLNKAVESYNKSVACLESRVLVSARKFKELGVQAEKAIESAEGIDQIPRDLQASN